MFKRLFVKHKKKKKTYDNYRIHFVDIHFFSLKKLAKNMVPFGLKNRRILRRYRLLNQARFILIPRVLQLKTKRYNLFINKKKSHLSNSIRLFQNPGLDQNWRTLSRLKRYTRFRTNRLYWFLSDKGLQTRQPFFAHGRNIGYSLQDLRDKGPRFRRNTVLE